MPGNQRDFHEPRRCARSSAPCRAHGSRWTAARILYLVIAGGIGLGTGGCGDDRITVVICGDVSVPDQVDAVRVELYEEDLQTRIRDGVLSLAGDAVEGEDEPPVFREFPVATSLARPTGRGWVRVEPLLEGTAVGRFDREILSFDGTDTVDAVLTFSCLRSTCAIGQTCLEGTCQTAPQTDEEPRCSM